MALKQAITGLILLALVSASLSDVTQEEIDRKGAEIMEEYRRDSGHWIHLGDKETIDHVRSPATSRAQFYSILTSLLPCAWQSQTLPHPSPYPVYTGEINGCFIHLSSKR